MGHINVTKIIFAVILSFSFSQVSYSQECAKPVTPIEKGNQAPCTGYLFSPQAESDSYKAKKVGELKEEENKILEKRLELYIKQSDVLAKQAASKQTTEGLMRFGYFVLGVAVTALVVRNVRP